MTDIKTLETRLGAALKRIETALDTPTTASEPPVGSDDLAAENAMLREQLDSFREERRADLQTIDQIMEQINQMTGGENA